MYYEQKKFESLRGHKKAVSMTAFFMPFHICRYLQIKLFAYFWRKMPGYSPTPNLILFNPSNFCHAVHLTLLTLLTLHPVILRCKM